MKPGRRIPPMNVLLNGRLVGTLRMERNGAISFVYAPDWLAWEHAVPISLSLPLREQAHRGAPIFAYLENLLPDSQAIRNRVAAKVHAESTDAYHLLEKLGRDCVGALQFVVGDENIDTGEPGTIQASPVSDDEVATTLKNLPTSPLGIEADVDFRISIAGAQEKTALLRINRKWFRPHGTTPTSHILKTQLGQLPNGINLSDSVENEFFCMRFCAAMGAEVAEVEMVDFDDVRALAIERFDRRWTRDDRLLRIPQEDFCQALRYPPSRKYQSDGGPGIRGCLELLSASDEPTEDQLSFLRAQVLFWLLGATDGHAKNFSIQLNFGGGFLMAPLYDVLSAQTAVDNGQIRFGQYKLAMSLGRRNHYRLDQVVARHFVQSAKAGGIGEGLTMNLLRETAARVDDAVEETLSRLPKGFPEELASSISRGIKRRSRPITA